MGNTRAPIECACGQTHRLSPTAMAVVITAFTRGVLHRVSGSEITAECILKAFDDKDIMKEYDGRYINFV